MTFLKKMLSLDIQDSKFFETKDETKFVNIKDGNKGASFTIEGT